MHYRYERVQVSRLGHFNMQDRDEWAILMDRNEIFGPVLTVVHADTLDDAIEIINRNK